MTDEDASQDEAPFKDPIPTVERISKLAARVLSGDIILPKFQRDFVWPRTKVIGLLDSIARNYPIGSILLWQSRKKLANERAIAGLPIATQKPDYPVNYLLDGQQRLSTVCGALHWDPESDPNPNGNSLWNIVFNLRTQKFEHLYTLDQPPLYQVPVRYFSDPSKFFRRVSAIDDPALSANADAMFNRFQDYMIAAVTLGDMRMDDIAPIFERINSTATPLTVVDLMRAATWDPTFDLRDSIDSILTRLESRNYGGIGRKTILRTVGAAADFGFAVDDIDRLRDKSVTELEAILLAVRGSSEAAVDFLTTHIRAPSAQALPYANQFAVLAELFRQVRAPSNSQFQAIERWFWRTTLSGYFSGWNTGQMSRDFFALKEFTEGKISEIEVPAALPRNDVWRLTQFRSNSAVSKMFALILSYNDPVDLLNGQRIDYAKSLAWSNDREFHHFFPKNFSKKKEISAGKVNAVANIVLLTSASNIKISDSAPSEYLRSIEAEIGRAALVSRLATLLVPEGALDAALQNDFPTFVSLRSEALQAAAMALIGEPAEEGSGNSAHKLADEVLVDDLGGDAVEEPPTTPSKMTTINSLDDDG